MLLTKITLGFIILLVQKTAGHETLTNSSVTLNAILYNSGNLKVDITNKLLLQIADGNKKGTELKLKGELGIRVPSSLAKPVIEIRNEKLNVNWQSKLSLTVQRLGKTKCYRVLWNSSLDSLLEDCYDFGKANWFGGPETIKQLWPVEQMNFKELPYITQVYDNIAKVEPYWLNSKGAFIYVNSRTPLFIDTNNHRLNSICLIANDSTPYMKRSNRILDYVVCGYSDPRKAHEHAIRNFLGKPDGLPDTRMVQHPIWSTWVRYKTNVNQTAVLEFAKDVVRNGFNNSQIEIDDNWETCYGSTYFNKSRFPDMKGLSKQLKDLGFRITIWVHPFVNLNCPEYSKLEAKGYFIKNVNGSAKTQWWDGKGSVVDVTKSHVVEWFRGLHNSIMKDNGIDGLKFDAGESAWLPQIPVLNCSEENHPNAFSSAYVDAISQFNSLTELRVAHQTQHYPMFVRMLDKDSKWTFSNGLPTLITTMLVMNIQGYPWVLPDMVGGNAYGTDIIDKELFVRWLQANTFMPSIQFSVAPWDFDYETIEISKKFTELHYKYSDLIIKLMKKSVKTGSPLNPPIWWVDPRNPTAHKINSEYLLGENILIAPILKQGTVRRDIYLPKGYWRDENHPHKIYLGRRWLKYYYADLATLPYFTKVSRTSYVKAQKHNVTV